MEGLPVSVSWEPGLKASRRRKSLVFCFFLPPFPSLDFQEVPSFQRTSLLSSTYHDEGTLNFIHSVCLFALLFKDIVCFQWSQNAACYTQYVFSVMASAQQPWCSTSKLLDRENGDTNGSFSSLVFQYPHIYTWPNNQLSTFYFLINR